MTHKERFLELLEEWGIEPCTDSDYVNQDNPNSISLVALHGNVKGYGGFVADFDFNEDGSFKEMGVWE